MEKFTKACPKNENCNTCQRHGWVPSAQPTWLCWLNRRRWGQQRARYTERQCENFPASCTFQSPQADQILWFLNTIIIQQMKKEVTWHWTAHYRQNYLTEDSHFYTLFIFSFNVHKSHQIYQLTQSAREHRQGWTEHQERHAVPDDLYRNTQSEDVFKIHICMHLWTVNVYNVCTCVRLVSWARGRRLMKRGEL